MARRYRFYAGVRQMPLQFNLAGMRVSMTVILLFLADLVTAVVLTVIASKFTEGTPFLIAIRHTHLVGRPTHTPRTTTRRKTIPTP